MLSAAAKADVTTARKSRSALWLWAIVAVGTLLRLVLVGHKSFWIDEIASVAIARRTTPVFWHFLWHDEGNMAAYYVLLRPWLSFGYGEGTVRLLSVIPGVLAIPLMYALGRKLFGERVGIMAALFVALNACAVSVSQEARAYSFVVLLVLLSTYLFARLIEEPSSALMFAYAVVAGLTCYFHYFGVLAPAAHYVSLVGVRSDRRPWKLLLPAAAIMALLVAPILWLIHAQDTGHISWVQPPSWLELYHLGAFLAADSGKAVGAVLLVVDLILIAIFLRSLISEWRTEECWRSLLPASLVFTPIVITLLVSAVRPAFYHRFLIICLPGWILMTAVAVERTLGRTLRGAAVVLVCALSLVSTAIVYRRAGEDWRGAVQYLIANGHSEDRALYYQPVGEFAGESYRDWLPGGDVQRPTPVPGDDGWEQKVDDASRVWLVLYRVKPEDAGVRAIEKKLVTGYSPAGRKDFSDVIVLAYQRKP
jgi:mannosyltransferase